MDVVSALVAHLQTPVAVQPRKCSLDHPSVSTQPLARLDTAPGDARGDTPLPERFAHRGKSYPLSACSFFGRLRGRPRGFRIGEMASTTSSKTFESWTLAAVCLTASGTPCRSTTTWRFEPCLPLSVGFAPVF